MREMWKVWFSVSHGCKGFTDSRGGVVGLRVWGFWGLRVYGFRV